MNVQELFRRLSYGELSNISLGSEGTGTIPEAKRAQVVHYANESLLRLYSRFVLRENDLILQTHEFITSYHFQPRFAVTNTEPCPGTTLYIIDHEGDPFQDDLIKVMTVTDMNNCPYPLNDREDCRSLFTPQPNVLQVPNPIQDQILAVGYQARHPLLSYTDLEACIELPSVLEGALTAHIAHMAYSNMNGQENSAKASEHLAKYEMICGEVVERDLVSSSSSTTNSKFHERGFV